LQRCKKLNSNITDWKKDMSVQKPVKPEHTAAWPTVRDATDAISRLQSDNLDKHFNSKQGNFAAIWK
jgi:hypothetical protein